MVMSHGHGALHAPLDCQLSIWQAQARLVITCSVARLMIIIRLMNKDKMHGFAIGYFLSFIIGGLEVRGFRFNVVLKIARRTQFECAERFLLGSQSKMSKISSDYRLVNV